MQCFIRFLVVDSLDSKSLLVVKICERMTWIHDSISDIQGNETFQRLIEKVVGVKTKDDKVISLFCICYHVLYFPIQGFRANCSYGQ